MARRDHQSVALLASLGEKRTTRMARQKFAKFSKNTFSKMHFSRTRTARRPHRADGFRTSLPRMSSAPRITSSASGRELRESLKDGERNLVFKKGCREIETPAGLFMRMTKANSLHLFTRSWRALQKMSRA